MGSCCGKQAAGPDAEIYQQAQRSRLPDTEADRAARAQAAAAVSGRCRLEGACPCWAPRGFASLAEHSGKPPTALPHTSHLLQAEARQQAWAGTAAGKAAIKSVKAVQEERAQGRVASNDTAKDWLT